MPVSGEVRVLLRHIRKFRRIPDLRNPKTFSEKMLTRLLFDRNPLLVVFSDKLQARAFACDRLGGDDHLTQLYGVAASVSDIAGLTLPRAFVMKPNHLSGAVRIVTDEATLSPGALETQAEEWLSRNYGKEMDEWAYRDIAPRVFFEELLWSDGGVPDDYKFFCYDGETRFLEVIRGRFDGSQLGSPRYNFYDCDFRLLPLSTDGDSGFEDEGAPPPNFSAMLDVARRLSAGVDFVRVDLYNISGRVVFGELTAYPGGGVDYLFSPRSWDLTFGAYWLPKRPPVRVPRGWKRAFDR